MSSQYSEEMKGKLADYGIYFKNKIKAKSQDNILKILTHLKENPREIHKCVSDFDYQIIIKQCGIHTNCLRKDYKLLFVVENIVRGFKVPQYVRTVLVNGLGKSVRAQSGFNSYNISTKNNGHYTIFLTFSSEQEENKETEYYDIHRRVNLLPDSFNFSITTGNKKKYSNKGLLEAYSIKFEKPLSTIENVLDYMADMHSNENKYNGMFRGSHNNCSHTIHKFNSRLVVFCVKLGNSLLTQVGHPQVYGGGLCLGGDSTTQQESKKRGQVFNYIRETIANLQMVALGDNRGQVYHSSHSFRNGVLLFNNPLSPMLNTMRALAKTKIKNSLGKEKNLLTKFVAIDKHYYDKDCYCLSCLQVKMVIPYGFVYDNYYFMENNGKTISFDELKEIMQFGIFKNEVFVYSTSEFDKYKVDSHPKYKIYTPASIELLINEKNNRVKVNDIMQLIITLYRKMDKFNRFRVKLSYFDNIGKIYSCRSGEEFNPMLLLDIKNKKFYDKNDIDKIVKFYQGIDIIKEQFDLHLTETKSKFLNTRSKVGKDIIREVKKIEKSLSKIDSYKSALDYINDNNRIFRKDLELRE